MQHVSRLTTAPSDKSAPPTNAHDNVKLLSEETLRQLWERMGMLYGHRWKASFGTSDDGTWRHGLSDITPAQLAVGLSRCVERKPSASKEDWPPTLAEFRAMCLPEKRDPTHRDYIALPRPPQDPNMAENALASMRAALAAKR